MTVRSRHLLIATVLIAIANGILSPWIAIVVAFAPLWYPAWAPTTPQVLLMMSSLVLSTLTLLLAGVPAALYERATGTGQSGTASLTIWLGAAALLSLPAVERLLS